MGKLSHKLLDLGFFSALGTTEEGKTDNRRSVGRGTPFTADKNQGTFVIYDENGWPWIKRTVELDLDALRAVTDEFPVKLGAYVPHSNDSGYFVRIRIPSLTGGKVTPEDVREKPGFDRLLEAVRQVGGR